MAKSNKIYTRRRRQRSSLSNKWLLLLLVVGLVVVAAKAIDNCSAKASQDADTQLMVSGAELCQVVMPAGAEGVDVDYKGFSMSFNPTLHIPNYVAWELTRDEAQGQYPRKGSFMEDVNVAGSATPADYKNSGYDRGHICPAGDAKWDSVAMEHTFYMTNMCPQAKALNTGAWKSLEENCRQWAQRDSALVIVAGPIVADRMLRTIGASGVAVPERFFKVILAPYANPPRAIGFIMPNGPVKGGMQTAACSVDQVEAATGYDFFSALPDDIENAIEAQCRINQWSRK